MKRALAVLLLVTLLLYPMQVWGMEADWPDTLSTSHCPYCNTDLTLMEERNSALLAKKVLNYSKIWKSAPIHLKFRMVFLSLLCLLQAK